MVHKLMQRGFCVESTHEARLARAWVVLEGLSVGDAAGAFFEFNHRALATYAAERKLPDISWRYTDDTNMALSIYANLRDYQQINADVLAQSFAEHFNPQRGYGPTTRAMLTRIRKGAHWKTESSSVHSGQGSYGNGSAMRVAPVGAYFADDVERAVTQAALTSVITHANPEAIAGAIAVAVATTTAARYAAQNERPTLKAFIEQVLAYVPTSDVRSGLKRAQDIRTTDSDHVGQMLGNGSWITAMDTVPFVVWSAATYLEDYTEAFWQTARAGGDVDTTCAMVGGIVAAYVGQEGIPAAWLENREPLPEWAL